MIDSLHAVVPAMVADPKLPSGGNVYDRELVSALSRRGVTVTEHTVADRIDLGLIPSGATVLVDGLLGLAQPGALDPRLRVVLLVHLPLSLASPDDPSVLAREREALSRAAAVVATSEWTRTWLLTHHRLRPEQVTVCHPGVRPAPLSSGSTSGNRLLVVGAVTRAKGHDVLVSALTEVADLAWTCRAVGPLDRDPAFVEELVPDSLADRFALTGPLEHDVMPSAYAAADLLVVPSRFETYGMVVTEALAQGVPVVAADTGGVAEALGRGERGRPGVLLRPDDSRALADALRTWLTDGDRRGRLRAAAAERREALTDWSTTAETLLRGLNRSSLRTVVTA